MSGLTRKRITVKRKGKTFQRSVMVRASDPIAAPKRYMSPGRFLSKHKNQFVGMFVHGAAQGASTYTAGRLVGRRYGKLAGVGAGVAAYKASDHIGTAIWKRAMGKKYDDINQDFSRLAPHTERAMTRVFHGVGHAGTVVGAVSAWGAHTIAQGVAISRDIRRVRRQVQEEERVAGPRRRAGQAIIQAVYRAGQPQRFRQLGSGR